MDIKNIPANYWTCLLFFFYSFIFLSFLHYSSRIPPGDLQDIRITQLPVKRWRISFTGVERERMTELRDTAKDKSWEGRSKREMNYGFIPSSSSSLYKVSKKKKKKKVKGDKETSARLRRNIVCTGRRLWEMLRFRLRRGERRKGIIG